MRRVTSVVSGPETLRIAARQAPLSMRFSRQEHRSGLQVPSSRWSSWPRDRTRVSYICLHWQAGRPPGKSSVRSHSHIPLFATPWAVARQAPLSAGFPRQEHRSGLSRPTPGDLPDPGIEPTPFMSPVLAGWQADSSPLRPPRKPVLWHKYSYMWGFPVAQMVKNLPALQETGIWSLGKDVPLEKGILTHSNMLAYRIPWTEEPGRPQWVTVSHRSRRVGHDWAVII